MSYTNLLQDEGINAQYLAVIRPCQKVDSWTLNSGSVYRASFSFGYVSSVEIDGVALNEGSSSTLSAGEFYWDNDSAILYVRASDSGDVNSDYVVVVYDIYVATDNVHWHRIPTDETQVQVFYEPLIARVPQIKSTVKDIAFGVLPIQSSGIVLNNAEKLLNKHLYYGSFKNRELLLYHWLDDLDVDNIKLVAKSRMDSLVWSDSQLTIKLFDAVDVFEKEFRSSISGTNFYSSSDYVRLDPAFQGKPVRYVYGIVDGFVPVNTAHVVDEAAAGDNKEYKVCSNGTAAHEATATVPSSPASTTTRTYLTSAQGFTVGDTALINKATDESVLIIDVSYGPTPYIDHAALSSGAASNGDTVIRNPVARADIFHQGVKYTALYGRDYTTTVDSSDILTLDFDTSLESNLGMPGILNTSDSVVLRVYGKTNDVTLGGNPYGDDDPSGGNLQALAPILLDVFKRHAGISEDDINVSSFTQLLSDCPDRLGFAIPEESSGKFPKIRELVADLCQTGIVSVYQDADLDWKATRIKAIDSVTGTLTDDTILSKSVSYEFNYSDLYSDVVVTFGKREKSDSGISKGYRLAKASSTTAKLLHKVTKTLEVDSLHWNSDDARTLATRLSAFFGDRQGVLTLDTKNEFFGKTIDESLDVQRVSLPGFEYDEDTTRTINFTIKQSDKSLRRVQLTLNDLKGVNDNSGEF